MSRSEQQARLGAVADLLANDEIEDIYLLGRERAFIVGADGRRAPLKLPPGTMEGVIEVIVEVLARDGKGLDGDHPCADGHFVDGSRFHVAIHPVAVPSPQVVIRRFRRLFAQSQGRLGQLVQLGTLTGGAALLLRYAVRSGVSLLVAGATAAGKTTLISALGGELDRLSPVVCIEDTRELDIPVENVSYLLARPASPNAAPITQRFLVQQALRKRPEYLILGEARGDEAWDFVQAGNTGHTIMGSVHANSARDALYRYRDMCLQTSGSLDEIMVLRNVLRAFHLVIYMAQLGPARKRVVTHIANATGEVSDAKIPVLHDLFVWDDNRLRCTRGRPYPNVLERLARRGLEYADVLQDRDWL